MPLGKASSTSPSISIFSSLMAALLLSRTLDHVLRTDGMRPRRLGRGRAPIASELDDVRRLRAFRALAGLVLDLRVLRERLEALTGDIAVVDEEVLAALVGRDEAVALRVVEPLHGSCCH